MSVAVVCNLSDGLILGVDSAITLTDSGSISKVFEDADKIFKLEGARVGVAFYGLAALEGRSIGSFVREFEMSDLYQNTLKSASLSDIAEGIRDFFFKAYVRYYEAVFSTPFQEINDEYKQALGLIVGGFSPGAYLSECWRIVVPWHDQERSALNVFMPGNFGASWFASSVPIMRYMNGYDPEVANEVLDKVAGIAGRDLQPEEENTIVNAIMSKQYKVNFSGMPIRIGVEWVRFLIDLVIGHYRFAAPHPIVGGKPKIGVVTYRNDGFEIRV